MIKQQNGKWHLYSKDGSKHLGGPYDTREEAVERERQVQYFKHAKAEVSMVITKASVQPDGSMRWLATTSDTSPDNTGESTSLALFQDWITRAESGATVEWLSPPRKPFLGVSHYSDLDGFGEAGATDKMYVEGDRFKAGGVSLDGPIAKSLFATLKNEMELINRGGAVDNPLRISAAWWDVEHSHGSFIFTRKSLTDICPMCERGEGNKVYLKGQLDHFATTRVPINPRTSLALQEKSDMTITRKEDAASIVGDELAEELENKSQLVGKSETEEETPLVVKAVEGKKRKPAKEDMEEMHEEDDAASGASEGTYEAEKKNKKTPAHGKGGSFMTDSEVLTFADARALPIAKSHTRLDLIALIRRNIAELPEAERLQRLESLMDEINTEVQQVKQAVEEVWLLQPDNIDDEDLPESEEVPPMDYLEQFTDAVSQALQSDQPKEEKAAVIQQALNGLAVSLKAELEGPAPAGDMVAALKAALSPLSDQLAQLNARLGATQAPVIQMPVQRSVTNLQQPQMVNPEPQLPVSPVTGKPSELTNYVRRSVGIY